MIGSMRYPAQFAAPPPPSPTVTLRRSFQALVVLTALFWGFAAFCPWILFVENGVASNGDTFAGVLQAGTLYITTSVTVTRNGRKTTSTESIPVTKSEKDLVVAASLTIGAFLVSVGLANMSLRGPPTQAGLLSPIVLALGLGAAGTWFANNTFRPVYNNYVAIVEEVNYLDDDGLTASISMPALILASIALSMGGALACLSHVLHLRELAAAQEVVAIDTPLLAPVTGVVVAPRYGSNPVPQPHPGSALRAHTGAYGGTQSHQEAQALVAITKSAYEAALRAADKANYKASDEEIRRAKYEAV